MDREKKLLRIILGLALFNGMLIGLLFIQSGEIRKFEGIRKHNHQKADHIKHEMHNLHHHMDELQELMRRNGIAQNEVYLKKKKILNMVGHLYTDMDQVAEVYRQPEFTDALTFKMRMWLWETKMKLLATQKMMSREFAQWAVTDRIHMSDDFPTISPTPGRVSSSFGMRTHPILKHKRLHRGIDIANKMQTPIRSSAKGLVIHSGNIKGYGKTVIVDHGNGFKTLYAHVDSLLVRTGDQVKQGDVIAQMGMTGLATGPHLHYEVLFGIDVLDPENIMGLM